MDLQIPSNSVFVFDLDDTLYPEITFLESAYKHIAEKISPITGKNIYNEMLQRYKNHENVFQWIFYTYFQNNNEITTSDLLALYRNHEPKINLNIGVRELLDTLKKKEIPLGLITDGRSITQRNKIKALKLNGYFNDVIISEEFGSEKPNESNYLYFENKYPGNRFYFIGDNTSKDFFVPLKLNWTTICLKNNGRNIHPQNLNDIQTSGLILNSFEELVVI